MDWCIQMNTDGKGILDICALTACKLVTLHPVAAVQQHTYALIRLPKPCGRETIEL